MKSATVSIVSPSICHEVKRLNCEVKVTQLCPTLCDPMDYTVHGILQARILEWVAIAFSKVNSMIIRTFSFCTVLPQEYDLTHT